MIKIGIAGTHGSGKTRKAIDLMEHYTFLGNKVNMVDEVARSCPYSLKTIAGQEWIWGEQMIRGKHAMSNNVNVVICDRTVMDNLVYYRNILNDGKGGTTTPEEWIRWAVLHHIAINWMPTYDQIIRLPLNLEWLQEDDPIRSKEVAYAQRIDRLFDRFIDKFVTDGKL